MSTVLVTGAGGVLGSAVVCALLNNLTTVIGVGRHAKPAAFRAQWRQVDLLTGEGVSSALKGVSSIVHCATNPQAPCEDQEVLHRLIEAATPCQIHLVYVGIAGIERAIASSEYYRIKIACEEMLYSSGCSFTLIRATQLHPFVEDLLRRLTLGPLVLAPNIVLQPIDPDFVAEVLVEAAIAQPRGRRQDLRGPEKLRLSIIVEEWLRAQQARRLVVPIPSFGPLQAFSELHEVQGQTGGRPWRSWLQSRASGR